MNRPATHRRWLIALIGIIAFLGIPTLVIIVNGDWDDSAGSLLGIYFVLLIALAAVWPLRVANAGARRIFATQSRWSTRYTVTDDEVAIDLPGTQIVHYWSGVHSAEQSRNVLILRNKKGAAIVAICLLCAGAQSAAELRMFLVGRGLLPQAYKIKI